MSQAQRLVRGVEPQALRDNDALRRHLAGQMASVEQKLESLIVERPRRQIIRSSRNGAGHATAD